MPFPSLLVYLYIRSDLFFSISRYFYDISLKNVVGLEYKIARRIKEDD